MKRLYGNEKIIENGKWKNNYQLSIMNDQLFKKLIERFKIIKSKFMSRAKPLPSLIACPDFYREGIEGGD
jgi:hypothetical protein